MSPQAPQVKLPSMPQEPHLPPVSNALGARIEVRAFGQSLSILAPQIDFLREDSLWRLHRICQPALATQTLAAEGVALDIGAGFGAFALPFAVAYPGWRVVCFEPDPLAFAYLQTNIRELALPQITALPFAVGYQKADAPQDPTAVRTVLKSAVLGQGEEIERLRPLLPLALHSKSKINIGYLERGCNLTAEFDHAQVPTIAAALLDCLAPRLIKLIAPKVEAEILADLSGSKIDHVIGESWGPIGSGVIHPPSAGLRQTWMPRAGQDEIALRKDADPHEKPSRLDIVFALSEGGADLATIEALLGDPSRDIRVLAVGNGSADQAVAVKPFAQSDPRLLFLTASNPGQSAAWNFGRLHSTATHLAFVNSCSLPQKGFFSSLFDLARQTGAEVVQGPHLFIDREAIGPSLMAEKAKVILGFEFADTTYHRLSPAVLLSNAPSIWRRVYRRDFLDHRKIWFPEDLKPSGDYVFQALSLHGIPNVPELQGRRLCQKAVAISAHEQSDCVLGSFAIILKHACDQGWNDFGPILQWFSAQVHASVMALNPQQQSEFIQSAAALWADAYKLIWAAGLPERP
jgi:hypothetical protein